MEIGLNYPQVCVDCGNGYTRQELQAPELEGPGLSGMRCPACNAWVWVVQARSVDPPFKMAVTITELKEANGSNPLADQCDNCGGVEYVLDVPKMKLRCLNCETQYPIFRERAWKVIW